MLPSVEHLSSNLQTPRLKEKALQTPNLMKSLVKAAEMKSVGVEENMMTPCKVSDKYHWVWTGAKIISALLLCEDRKAHFANSVSVEQIGS